MVNEIRYQIEYEIIYDIRRTTAMNKIPAACRAGWGAAAAAAAAAAATVVFCS